MAFPRTPGLASRRGIAAASAVTGGIVAGIDVPSVACAGAPKRCGYKTSQLMLESHCLQGTEEWREREKIRRLTVNRQIGRRIPYDALGGIRGELVLTVDLSVSTVD